MHAQPWNTQSNLCMGPFVHGGRMLRYVVPQPPDARRFAGSGGPPGGPFTNILNDTMLDEFPSYHSGNSYADLMRGKLMETSKGKTPCHLGSSFANMPSGGGMSAPADEFPVQPLESVNQYYVQMNAPSTHVVSAVGNASKFPGLVGNCSNSWHSATPSEFTGILHRDATSLVPSQVNIPRINQPASYAASSGQMPLQNQMAPFISNTTSVAGFSEQMVPFNVPSNPSSVGMLNARCSAPMAPTQMVNGGSITTSVAGFSEQMAPFNMASNTSSVGTMLNDNFAPGTGSTSMAQTQMVNSGSTSSALSNLQTDGSVAVTQMLNGGDAAGILPMKEGTVDKQALNDQQNDSNAFSLDDIFANMLNEDLTGDDAIMDGEG